MAESKRSGWASLVVQMVKNPPADMGDTCSSPGAGRSPGEGNGNPLQYSCLENPMDREAWQATVHEVTKSQKQLRDFTHFQMRGEGSKEERKQEI